MKYFWEECFAFGRERKFSSDNNQVKAEEESCF